MKLTVIPSDNTIIMDGRVLVFSFAAPAKLHAIQWSGAYGYIETTDGKQVRTDSIVDVQPFIDAFSAESARLLAIATKPKTPAEIAAENSAAAKRELVALDLASIRAMREYIAAKVDAPQLLKDKEAAAVLARAKL